MKLFTLLLLGTSLLSAAPLLQLTPSSTLAGFPGQTTGWGFSLTSDSQFYISVTGSLLTDESNPTLGTYTDFIGLQGGPADFSFAPNSPAWTQTFDSLLSTGIGSYTLLPSASIGASNSGQLRVLFEYFNDNPLTCDDCFVSSSFVETGFTFQVEATAAVPEPSTFALAASALLFLYKRT